MRMALAAGFVAAALMITGTYETQAQSAKAGMVCQDKGGRGWGGSVADARFQAWEAVLQGTDWGMWAAWMANGARVGQAASGYKVSNVREKCENDPSGKVCLMRAKLCR